MVEYKGTEKFDIGAGYGEYEYDFHVIHCEEDFWALMNHYGAIYKRFNYFLDGYEVIENNTGLSPVVLAKMKEHNANLSLTLLESEFKEKNLGIRKMVVNEQEPNGNMVTYSFYFFHFATLRAGDHFERGCAFARYGLHNAAIKHFTFAIELDPRMGHAFVFRGISYQEKKNYDKAIEDFTQAIKFNPKKSESFSIRGLAYEEAGDFEKAKADFERALELNPNDEVAKEYLEKLSEE